MSDRTPLNADEAQFAAWLATLEAPCTPEVRGQAVARLATAYMEERLMAARLASELVASRAQVKKLQVVVNSIASVLLEAGPTNGTPVKSSSPQLRVVRPEGQPMEGA